MLNVVQLCEACPGRWVHFQTQRTADEETDSSSVWHVACAMCV